MRNSRENIFTIVYNTIYTKSDHNAFVIYVRILHPSSCCNIQHPNLTLGQFVYSRISLQKYDPTDTRRSDSWLYGQQYDIARLSDDGFVIPPLFEESNTGMAGIHTTAVPS